MKITFIGAGSFGFTRTLVKDMMHVEALKDAQIALMDIHSGRLEMALQSCQRIIDAGNYKATVSATTDRRAALANADAVIITILCGDTDVWQHDILIPKKYGVDINVGDTRGPAGVFRALRTIPTMLDICRDIEQLCPKALVLNYTNPMAMLCHAMQKTTDVNVTGLCHSVQGTAHMLAKWAGVEPGDVDYVCGGINHLAWYLKFEHGGRDLYPAIRSAVETNRDIYNQEHVRNEMFLAMGYYVTESSGHNSEYNWWFRKRPDLIAKYCHEGTNWNPGVHAYILDEYRKRENTWHQDFNKWLDNPDWNDAEKRTQMLAKGHEYAADIIGAYVGGDLFCFNGNVPNTGLIDNLPAGACVEVPVLASHGRLQPIHVGALPAAVLPLTHLSSVNETIAVDGCLAGDREMVYHSIINDPLTASVLSLKEIRAMVEEMFATNQAYLPQFK